MTWSAAQYVKFEDERTRPVHDLVARIPNAVVVGAADIGCGPGNSTEVLRERYPRRADRRPRLFSRHDRGGAQAASRHRFRGRRHSANGARKQPFDVILANAVLQWIPGHETLIPGAHRQAQARRRARGANAGQSRRAVASADGRDRKRRALGGEAQGRRQAPRRAPSSPDWYFRLLRAHAPHVDVWRTTYFHPLAGAPAIVEWLKGTGLRPFLDPLDESEREAFLARYEAAIAEAYPAEADGTVLLPFPRLFCRRRAMNLNLRRCCRGKIA